MNNETIESIKRYNIRATEEIKRLKEENKQLKQRNKEIYDGFKAATDELCEYATKIDKAIDKLYCYGEVFDSKILQQFQREMIEILGDKE